MGQPCLIQLMPYPLNLKTRLELCKLVSSAIKVTKDYYLSGPHSDAATGLDLNIKQAYQSFKSENKIANEHFNNIYRALKASQPGLKSAYFTLAFFINQLIALKPNQAEKAKRPKGWPRMDIIDKLRWCIQHGQPTDKEIVTEIGQKEDWELNPLFLSLAKQAYWHFSDGTLKYRPRHLKFMNDDEYSELCETNSQIGNDKQKYTLPPSGGDITPGETGLLPRISLKRGDGDSNETEQTLFTKVVPFESGMIEHHLNKRVSDDLDAEHFIGLSGVRDYGMFSLVTTSAYTDSTDLLDYLNGHATLEPEKAIQIARAIYKDYEERFYHRGVVHTDIKADNIRIKRDGEGVRIIDLDLACALDSANEKLGGLKTRASHIAIFEPQENRIHYLSQADLQNRLNRGERVHCISNLDKTVAQIAPWALVTHNESYTVEPSLDFYSLSKVFRQLFQKAGFLHTLSQERSFYTKGFSRHCRLETINDWLNTLELEVTNQRSQRQEVTQPFGSTAAILSNCTRRGPVCADIFTDEPAYDDGESIESTDSATSQASAGKLAEQAPCFTETLEYDGDTDSSAKDSLTSAELAQVSFFGIEFSSS
ncbi:MAG: hypothetical protein COV52_04970 [Gammaproteobacteria bacterium CG11_big_fil_rev_8_21_14_0_20_46_22]|nr:MAG: hypothetical protein COW05_04735 [Gammaproteobacteria bacterium CG12_big_fil_rev_8_21_14_0_65_46_12]PIR11215.1 MAG: hypothetical protein COV52_04970 [Gammaproteobacteria bacterium CG11_big_fil_rev_8_21_14_0_20_46_22]